MSAEDLQACPFRAEMAAIVRAVRSSGNLRPRDAAFEALSRLERLALLGGASDATLRDIAEARFLTGILRDSIGAARRAPLRAILRSRAAVA